jgi:hypothetical protein
MHNRLKISLWVATVLFAISSTALCSAQMAEKEKMSMETVTGCLQKGGETGGFYIAGDNGKVWELHSKKVSLAEHVGHTVTVSGPATMETKEDEAKIDADEKKEYGDKEHGDLRVHHLKMVSESCK